MRSGNTPYNSSAFHRALAKITRLRSGQRVLDLGCGRGRTLGALLDLASPGGGAVGLDISPEQLALAAAAHAEAVSSGRLHLVQHDATKPLPFAEGTFDALVCQNVVECIPDKQSFLRECSRVLQTAGIMVLGHHDFDGVVLASSDRDLTQALVHDYAKAQLPGMPSADAQMGRQLPDLVRGSRFRELETLATMDVDLTLDGDGSIVDLLESLYNAAARNTGVNRLRDWRDDQSRRAANGDFYCAVPWICVTGVK